MSKKYFLLLIVVFLISGCASQDINGKQAIKEIDKANTKQQPVSTKSLSKKFDGNKGQKVLIDNDEIMLDEKIFADGLVHYYNTETANGEIVYFFVIKDKNGIYRAAANACQVCFESRMGFRQESDFMVCNTCGNKYPLEKIATEKGGCNPVPINPSLEVKDAQIIIEQSDLEQIYEFF